MPIDLETCSGKEKVDATNFPEAMQKLSTELRQGTPVMIHNYTTSSLPMSSPRTDTRILFYSGGSVNKDGIFNLRNGKRGFAYATINGEETNRYQVIHHWEKQMKNHPVNIPGNWTMDQYNEGTFSLSGGANWKSIHGGGTAKIVVGKTLEEKFPDAFRAVKFASDAVYFQLHPAYSDQNALITEIGDDGIGMCENEINRSVVTHRIACVRAAMNLINQARHDKKGAGDQVVAYQIGQYRDADDFMQKSKRGIGKNDFLIKQGHYPDQKFAFVKSGEGLQYGETYILPFDKNMDELIEFAFSDENVGKIYPLNIG